MTRCVGARIGRDIFTHDVYVLEMCTSFEPTAFAIIETYLHISYQYLISY